ncbi:hypothetical protein E5288_WYG006661 [Bos mutus]|uniref:Uncharacterized protein n=1 Tax=Bos mutus TaxID=72004 RepID=A0A6B0RKE1_9CETA|nr:hypothetical protein [Bos mutus]
MPAPSVELLYLTALCAKFLKRMRDNAISFVSNGDTAKKTLYSIDVHSLISTKPAVKNRKDLHGTGTTIFPSEAHDLHDGELDKQEWCHSPALLLRVDLSQRKNTSPWGPKLTHIFL